MIKYVAIQTIDLLIKDEVYDIDFIFDEDTMDKFEFKYNIIDIYHNGKLIESCNESILEKRFKPLAEVRQERLIEILND